VAKGYNLSPEAEQDLQQIRAHYLEKAGAPVARYVLSEITRGFRLLAATPGAGHSRADLTDEPVKFWSVFAYLIVYDPTTQPLGIARVLHGRRDLETLLQRQPPRA
jgi:toxin ParE1/3/4